MVGMLFTMSIVLLELLSVSLISCAHIRHLVGVVFFYLLLTSVKSVFRNHLSNMAFIAELSLRTMYPKQIILQQICYSTAHY